MGGGVLIGLGTAAKLYPALVLIPLAVLCLRAGKVREFTVVAAAAVASWLVVNLADHGAVPQRMVGVLPLQLVPRDRP